ncbi:hypothetical protein SAMD00023378_1804 [Ralstonia sp. NT80]|uniref:hypothetical protein n=1 Tax=Ralstonia sp. NT80 TaxID=1218247 RepID=UPI00066AC868|nr:hypothetical protein [Ralstonia sp. NT80]GAQ28121.1 hypothetical protein SAMD00023378_1804 [Ralstonia sp. NT80]
MFTFLLIVSSTQCPDIYALVSGLGVTRRESGLRCLAHAPDGMEGGWIAIQALEHAEVDYDEDELKIVTSSIKAPRFFLVEGRDGDLNFANRFVLGLDADRPFLIDNDHGLIDTARHMQQRINAGKDWLHLPG